MKTNQSGIDLIKLFEGLRLNAYLDPVGIPTIGWGTTRIDGNPVKMGTTITEQEAEGYLKKDLEEFEKCVTDNVTSVLDENQFSALVSFCYNLGCGSLKKSTLLKRLNAGDYLVGNEFEKWVKADGKVLAGLVKRRAAERELFERDIASPTDPVINEPAEAVNIVLKKGSRGDTVKNWQTFLNSKGFDCGTPDGVFGDNTKNATKKFQQANGLSADGAAGKNTLAKAIELGFKLKEESGGGKIDASVWDKIKDLKYSDWKNIFNKHLDYCKTKNRVSGSPKWHDDEGTLNVIGIRCNDERDFNFGKYNDYLVMIMNRPNDEFRMNILKVTVDPGIPNQPGEKNRAHLCQGVWNSYVVRPHRWKSRTFPKIGFQPRWALCQDKDEVEVVRTDSTGKVVGNERGQFGINIHDTGGFRDSSIGCTVVQDDNDYVDTYLPYIYDVDANDYVPSNHNDLTYCLINQNKLEEYLG